jgi:hypothetical protein
MDGKKRSRLRAFGLALVASLVIAVTSAASASALSLTPKSPATFPVSLSLNAPWTVTFPQKGNSTQFTCQSATGSGQMTSGTKGELKITYNSCNYCGTSMVTSNLEVKPVYLDAAKTKWGFKVTPIGTNVYAECSFGGMPLRYSGSVLGLVSAGLGETTTSFSYMQTWANWGEQEYQQVEGAGPKYHLTGSWAGKEEEAAVWLNNPITSGAALTVTP